MWNKGNITFISNSICASRNVWYLCLRSSLSWRIATRPVRSAKHKFPRYYIFTKHDQHISAQKLMLMTGLVHLSLHAYDAHLLLSHSSHRNYRPARTQHIPHWQPKAENRCPIIDLHCCEKYSCNYYANSYCERKSRIAFNPNLKHTWHFSDFGQAFSRRVVSPYHYHSLPPPPSQSER